MADNILRWLHLSDLHMRRETLDDLRVVLKTLWTDIKRQMEASGGRFDFVAFTGDIAYAGQAKEFEDAHKYFFQPLIKYTGIASHQLMFVPGNHDVNRTADSWLNLARVPELLADHQKASRLLGNDDERRMFFDRMADYSTYVREFRPKGRSHSTATDPAYSYNRILTIGDYRVAILGLNSVWLSGCTSDSSKRLLDHGNLMLTQKQLMDATSGTEAVDIRIALMHHPLAWLEELDQRDAEAWIQKECALLLHGHLHETTIRRVQTIAGETIVIPCGTLYKGERWLNGYNIGVLDLETGVGGVILRQYSSLQKDWVKDSQATADVTTGYYPFVIERLFRKTGSGSMAADNDADLLLLRQAYLVTSADPRQGHELYWEGYRRFRKANRGYLLQRLARLTTFQQSWLRGFEAFVELYRGAARCYEAKGESKHEAEMILRQIAGSHSAPEMVQIEANLLLANIVAPSEDDPSISYYERVIELGREVELRAESPGLQQDTRDAMKKSHLRLAGIYEARRGADSRQMAEEHVRHGLEIAVLQDDPALETAYSKRLIGLLNRQGGNEQEIRAYGNKVRAIEEPIREKFRQEALAKAETGDEDYLYYAISALKHGLGYELQRININILPNGSAHLVGEFTLLATTLLPTVDAYLQTVPGTQSGVHFRGAKSLTPKYVLTPRHFDDEKVYEKVSRLEITIDPPMQPGDQFTYQWWADASELTFATTPEQLRLSGWDFEYASWQIIAPMRRLEIHVSVPAPNSEPSSPPWYELWRIGPVPKPTTGSYLLAVQTAYRALAGDESGGVRLNSVVQSSNRRDLSLEVQYPWLAMRYVLAWRVE